MSSTIFLIGDLVRIVQPNKNDDGKTGIIVQRTENSGEQYYNHQYKVFFDTRADWFYAFELELENG